VIADGRIVASCSPNELGGRGQAASMVSFDTVGDDLEAMLAGRVAGEWSRDNGRVVLSTTEPVRALNALTGWALEHDTELGRLEVRRPTLEDVYLELTGGEEKSEEAP
jgi:ABC-2 type transport system ATP-binding protein